jgi:ornithine carbamoyltransferase
MAKHLIRIIDCEVAFLHRVLELATEMKSRRREPSQSQLLAGLAVAAIYEKPSTRTKVSFEVGIRELGAQVVELTRASSQISRGETLADTARTLERYVDAIVFRAQSHASVVELARNTRVPVINALTDLYHPCQVLSDLVTIQERFGTFAVPIAFVGNGSNIAHSLLGAAAKLGLDLTIATPTSARPLPEIVGEALALGAGSGAKIALTGNARDAVSRAKVIYTDVWFDMGKDDADSVQRRSAEFAGFQVNARLLEAAPDEAVVMHCLPAQRGREATDDVLDGPRSIIFDQAESRLHTQKAILCLLLGRAQ